MEKIAKYLTLLLVGIAIVFGIIKLTKKEQLRFITPKKIVSQPKITALASKKESNTSTRADQKSKIPLFASNYLIVKVPSEELPEVLIYQDTTYPLRKIEEQKGFALLATPIIKKPIPKKRVEVSLRYKRRRAFAIPLDALITYNDTTYLLIKDGNQLRAVEAKVLAKKREKHIALVQNELSGKEVALASKERLLQELRKLLHLAPTKTQAQPK